jgi:hypothetical protein
LETVTHITRPYFFLAAPAFAFVDLAGAAAGAAAGAGATAAGAATVFAAFVVLAAPAFALVDFAAGLAAAFVVVFAAVFAAGFFAAVVFAAISQIPPWGIVRHRIYCRMFAGAGIEQPR